MFGMDFNYLNSITISNLACFQSGNGPIKVTYTYGENKTEIKEFTNLWELSDYLKEIAMNIKDKYLYDQISKDFDELNKKIL